MSSGKGDKPRPCNKARFDRNYTFIFGQDCKNCNGTGKVREVHEHLGKMDSNKQWNSWSMEDCPFCDGLGRVDKNVRQ